MKQILKKTLSILMAIMMVMSFAFVGSASEDSTQSSGGTLSVISYNVAGLPDFSGLLGTSESKSVPDNQTEIGKQLNISDFDIIALQEDFSYHSYLESEMTNYEYSTIHTGGIPVGSGLSIFSITTIYNEYHETWNDAYGIILNGADCMTPKGIVYCVVDLGDGVYVDVYNIHADAYEDEGSIDARAKNLAQLADLILANDNDRPVIVLGDTNSMLTWEQESIYENLIEPCGLSDAWVEFCNDGNYEIDYDTYDYDNSTDSIDRVLYKNGGGIELTLTDFGYTYYRNEDGTSCSDHSAAYAYFDYEITDEFVENTQELYIVEEDLFESMITKIKLFFSTLFLLLTNLDEVYTYITVGD